MKVVGITGGIGSGKTTVSKLFEALGIPVYLADIQAKKLMLQDQGLKNQIKVLLGNEAFYKNGRPNRAFIASKIFTNTTHLNSLNNLVHPAVGRDFEIWKNQQSKKLPYVIQEAALFVENGTYKKLDALIVVTCPEKERIRRVMLRDNVSEEQVKQRMANQLSEEDKISKAHYIITNDGNHTLIPQVWKIHQELSK